MSVTRDDIVREAVELLKRDGLDALSLRKLAARLKITAPTLYWHVANKRELLDLVAEELVRSHRDIMLSQPPPGQPWWDWLRLRLWETYDALITVRDAPRVLAGNRPRLESLSHIDTTLKTLMDAGLPPADAQQALFALGSYVVGSAIEWQAEADRAREGIGIDAGVVAAIKGGEFPHIEIAMRGVTDQPPEATFRFGLDLLIDALRARYAPSETRDTSLSVES